ncbi:MAG TPA: class I SAM-dependent methyltransferase [Candidatus Nanoarchaeia archaeon]|nr:class I SAM-dependent methyltransferase [Candidatus Nanoarchaeia archaeon]
MDYKTETKKTYEKYAKAFEQKFSEFFELRVKEEADLFLKHLKGKKILDLGAGPGTHAKYFQDKGYDVLCIDLSEEMVKICREKGLKAEVMDIENLQLPEKSFDGVWAYASLLHVPREKIPQVIKAIAKILKPGGILGVAVKEGKGQNFETNEKYPGTERWFTYFTDEEMKQSFADGFELVHSSKTNAKNKYVFLNYFFRRLTD